MSTNGNAQIDIIYQEPVEAIRELADAPLTPAVMVDKEARWMILLDRQAYKSIAELAATELRLAGLRINPDNYGPSRSGYYRGLSIKDLETGKTTAVTGLPDSVFISNVSWSPNFEHFAFTLTLPKGIELWTLDLQTAAARRLTKPMLSDVFWGNPYQWKSDSKGFLCQFRLEEGPPENQNELPKGPVVLENMGKKAPNRTFQDLLKNRQDEIVFQHYTTSWLAWVGLDGKHEDFLDANMYRYYSIAPGGAYVLVKTMEYPFSYMVPYYRFPFKTSVYDTKGKLVKMIYESPLAEELPKGFQATPTGPREIFWRNDHPASLYWVEALDGGDPRSEAEFRDALYYQPAPFDQDKIHLINTKYRFSIARWGNDELAMVQDYWWKDRKATVYQINPSKTNPEPRIIFTLNTEDNYNHPGYWLTDLNEYGKNVLKFSPDGSSLYLEGEGYSPEGNRPFIDEYLLKENKTRRLWQASGQDSYEHIVKVIDIHKGELITSVEQPDVQPNYYLRNIYKRVVPKPLTDFPHPYEQIKGVTKELIKYKRADGVDLTATLYLPAGYNKEKDGPLPMLLWAYPREFKDANAAGQVKESPHRFIRLYYSSPVYWVANGYAVLDRADFPIIGEGDQEPNDDFIPQLVSNAQAAIDNLAGQGIIDPKRVGVGGHSYGAFMVANLLSHSDLFAAGIARSGAYNRTLTPFGFQAEERTLWEAPEVYIKMSPFMHADKMNEPLLLIHGEADNNSGTYPMQSERYYNALKGHGATVRLVMLPHESHGYAARESVMHMLWEMDMWLEAYVKKK